VYKSTADSGQFFRRDGNHSTKGTGRGTNLLGWGEAENLTPEQQRAAMAKRVTQINFSLKQNKETAPKWQLDALRTEKLQLEMAMREIRPSRRNPGVENFFVDVARGRLTPAEFNIWMGEAAERMRRKLEVE
jgi:prephenate dehydratase